MRKLDLRHAGQLKDSVVDYMIDRDVPIRELRLDAANLISDSKWVEFFRKMGHRLEKVQLSWLDYSMTDETVQCLAENCPQLQTFKLKRVFCVSEPSLKHIARLQQLRQLSLSFTNSMANDEVSAMIRGIGSHLQRLSLDRFQDVDDGLLETIHMSCQKLKKLRIRENDSCSDRGFAALFTNWKNLPLLSVNLSRTRSVDYGLPDGPEDATGLASDGFRALMAHSGQRLERLNISSCRHIGRDALCEVFDGRRKYPALKDVDLSFVSKVDTTVVAGLFKSCPAVQKVAAFGCFDVKDIVVPSGVALVGVPTAQDSIIQTNDLGQLQADIKMDLY